MAPELLDLAGPGAYWLALGAAGGLVVWLRVRRHKPRGAKRFGWGRPIYLRQQPRVQRRSYRAHAEAERRAAILLKEIAGEVAFAEMIKRGYLAVHSPTFPSRVYLVPERQGPVTVCEHGRPVMRLCVQTVERVPDYDTVVMHKLMIEGSEREYLRVANRV